MKYFLVTMLLLAGCQGGPSPETHTAMFAPEQSEYELGVLIDMSGSFADMMAEGGKGYEFLMQLVDQYFRDRIGGDDKILIAQISGNPRFLLWEGTPLQLRTQFQSPQQFAALLRTNSDPNGSPVHLAMADTLEYIMADANASAGKAKCALFVLSDMLDNSPKSAEIRDRVTQDLKRYAQLGGALAIYYCDQTKLSGWRRVLQECGLKNPRVEAEIVVQPALPNFE